MIQQTCGPQHMRKVRLTVIKCTSMDQLHTQLISSKSFQRGLPFYLCFEDKMLFQDDTKGTVLLGYTTVIF